MALVGVLLLVSINIISSARILVRAESSPPLAYLGMAANGGANTRNTTVFIYVKRGEHLKIKFIKEMFNFADKTEIGEMKVNLIAPDKTTEVFTIKADGVIGDEIVIGRPTPVGSGINQDGVWKLSFEYDNRDYGNRKLVNLGWNIGVYNPADQLVKGRVWTKGINMGQPHNSATANLSYYILTPDGYLYKIILNSFNGINSFLQATASGVTDTNCLSLYKSSNESVHYSSNFSKCNSESKIFFEDPTGAGLPESVMIDDEEVILSTSVKETVIKNLRLAPDNPDQSLAGKISADVFNHHSNLTIYVDTDDNGVFDDANDRIIAAPVIHDKVSVNFDGKTQNGEMIDPSSEINIKLVADRKGEVHFVRSDVERSSGIEIRRLNGSSVKPNQLFWNDEELTERCGVQTLDTNQNQAIMGVNSLGGVHGWDANGCVTSTGVNSYGDDLCVDEISCKRGGSWGNRRSIDDWTYDTGAVVAFASYRYTRSSSTPSAPNTGQNDNGLAASIVGVALAGLGILGLAKFTRRKVNNFKSH